MVLLDGWSAGRPGCNTSISRAAGRLHGSVTPAGRADVRRASIIDPLGHNYQRPTGRYFGPSALATDDPRSSHASI